MLDALDMLFADRKIGAASKLAFLQLWRFARGQPGHVVITADWLAGRCGRSPRSAWDWLDDLEKHDLIKIGERNERRGSVEVFVYSPAPGSSADREAIPDPQLKLDLQSTDREAIPDRKAIMQRDAGGETAGVLAPKPPTSSAGVSGVSAQKSPRPLVPKKNKDLSYQSTKESKDTRRSKDTMETDGEFSMADAFRAISSAVAVEPAVDKDRIKTKIRSVCGGVSDWVCGSAANLVVYHGVPEEDLQRILCDVQAMREVGSLRNAGSFFHCKARQLAERHGKPWPRRGGRQQ